MSLSRREKEFISYRNFFLRNYISFDIQTNISRLRSKHITKPPKCLFVSILEVFFQLRSVPADTPDFRDSFFVLLSCLWHKPTELSRRNFALSKVVDRIRLLCPYTCMAFDFVPDPKFERNILCPADV